MKKIDGDPNAIIFAEFRPYKREMCLVETTTEGSRNIYPVTADGKVDENRLGYHVGSRREETRIRKIFKDSQPACLQAIREMREMYPEATGADLQMSMDI